jgi:tetratricopeptide (TPR) repeat protein
VLFRSSARRAQAQKIVEDARGEVERAEQMLILPGFDPQALSKAVDNAATALMSAIQIDPNVATAYSLRGRAFALAGDLDRAIEDFSRAIELDPGSAQTRTLRGLAYLRRGFRLRRAPRLLTMLGSSASWNAIRPTAEASAAFGAAAGDFDRVKAPAGGFVAAFAAGARALAAGDGEGAVSALSRASLLDPQNADAIMLLGIADMAVGWDEKAEDRFKVALIIRPNWAEARMWRAAARNRQGLDESAVEDAKAGLALQPADPDLLILAGRSDEAARRYPKDAIALARGGDVQAAVGLGGEGVEALNVLCARARLAGGDTEGAREFALKAIEANPDYAPARTVMAALHRAGGRIEEARESLDRALKLDPADPEALKLRAEMKGE